MTRGLHWLGWLVRVQLVLALGCEGGRGNVVPPDELEGKSLAELDRRIEELTVEATLIEIDDMDPNRCEPLCELTRAICEIKTKMCSIVADRVIYQYDTHELCSTAEFRCCDASESCNRCVSGEAKHDCVDR